MKIRTAAVVLTTLLALSIPASVTVSPSATAAAAVAFGAIVPAPVSAVPAAGVTYRITAATALYSDVAEVGEQLARRLRRSTGYPVPIVTAPPADGIALRLGTVAGGEEAYQLDVTATGIVVLANGPAGLFDGVQTLRQLLPYAAEAETVQPGPWPVPGGRVVDRPRYPWRGAMLDVARHFFPVDAVERYLDQIALYKINRLHLHLSDDQGWRIAIDSWPRLASYGGGTAVGGDPGGSYTKAQYQEIVAYAAARNITVIPEIDMPGHTNAALASYGELTCDGVAPPRYTGTDVGFSSLCTSKEITYTFVDQVIGELAALTPGPYLHIGGDEASSTTPADYRAFVDRAQGIVAAHGKTVIGWHDVVNATPLPTTVVQYWGSDPTETAVSTAGRKVVMSPASRAYLDMKYNRRTPLGQTWAGTIEVKDAYGWDPGAYLRRLPPEQVLGVEAPLWTETLRTSADLEYMAFPRLPALAELGWSPSATHDWTAFRQRLGAQGPRWRVMGIAYYRSTQIAWPSGS
ncbi:beta-N-acetylhexosaminidase [Nonomuraea sp. NPDC001831]|uniref:beta-N-acetylhexosaminidase n=1 Tax=Nonomuraea sp. NPDC001831 TaxID=3364340 RepID=UPI00367B2726